MDPKLWALYEPMAAAARNGPQLTYETARKFAKCPYEETADCGVEADYEYELFSKHPDSMTEFEHQVWFHRIAHHACARPYDYGSTLQTTRDTRGRLGPPLSPDGPARTNGLRGSRGRGGPRKIGGRGRITKADREAREAQRRERERAVLEQAGRSGINAPASSAHKESMTPRSTVEPESPNKSDAVADERVRQHVQTPATGLHSQTVNSISNVDARQATRQSPLPRHAVKLEPQDEERVIIDISDEEDVKVSLSQANDPATPAARATIEEAQTQERSGSILADQPDDEDLEMALEEARAIEEAKQARVDRIQLQRKLAAKKKKRRAE